jgi:hypothetical protein
MLGLLYDLQISCETSFVVQVMSQQLRVRAYTISIGPVFLSVAPNNQREKLSNWAIEKPKKPSNSQHFYHKNE